MRIIAGRFKGRTLIGPKGHLTRPTSDRVREALFSALGNIEDAVVADLYAGTGALGLEALSRGARIATFVESSRSALISISRNIETLGLAQQTRVMRVPLERAICSLAEMGPFNLVFADPPYAIVNRAAELLQTFIETAAMAAPPFRVVLEHASKDEPRLRGPERIFHRCYGDTGVSIFAADEPAASN